MALEQLWSVEFVSGMSSEGGGVIVLEKSKILGGDNNYFYVGSYDLRNNNFNATIDVKHYHGDCNLIFGKLEEFILKLKGSYHEDEMQCIGNILEDPSRELRVRLKYHAEVFQKLRA
jgi:hypothetical protein